MNNSIHRKQKGSALIAIFWIMAILGAAVFASIAVVKVQADTVTAESHGRRARAMAERGVALCSLTTIQRSDPILNFQNPEINEGFRATYSSLASTFGFNDLVNTMISQREQEGISSTESLLGQILTLGWEMEETEAQIFLDSLVEWVDEDGIVSTLEGWEAQNYEYEGFTGRPFNRFFKSLDEVEFVHGYDALLNIKPNWKEYFNIWTPAEIDLVSATPEIISLASLTNSGPALFQEDAQEIQSVIRGDDGLLDTEDDLPNPNPQNLLSQYGSGDVSEIVDRFIAEAERPQFFLIDSTGWSGNVTLNIKIALQSNGNRPSLLERLETIDYSQNE